jgi:probable F420-dependent oxidoreductase
MGTDHDAVRERLGRIGAWTFAFDEMPAADVRKAAVAIEALGFPALWIPESSSGREIFSHLSLLLSSTSSLTVCSGIANVTARHPVAFANGAKTLADAFGERPVFGIGIGHQYSTGSRGIDWSNPLGRMRDYLDGIDGAPSSLPDPAVAPRRLLAALGDGMLRLSAERALGAHSYFVPVSHTAHARDVLGPESVLAVELTTVVETDPVRARAIARDWTSRYLELPNYANNLRRMGFGEEDVAGGGSDALVDAAIAWGSAEAIAARVHEHLDAGADHVCLQVISGVGDDPCLPQLTELAGLLL